MTDYERHTAKIDGDFVVFLIGARFRKPWMLFRSLWTGIAFDRMVRELEANPDSGYLGGERWSGRSPVMIQYWKSAEQLIHYARSSDAVHFPAWVKFNRWVARSGAVGIWHETYLVKAGNYECVYGNMPPFGLAKAAGPIPLAGGKMETATGRLGQTDGADMPITVEGEVVETT